MGNLQAVAMLAAAIHIPLALTVWSMLYRRWRRLPLRLWVAGSLAMGGGATLLAAEGQVPGWASGALGNALMSAAPALRIAALRLDLGWPVRAGWLTALCVFDFSAYLFSVQTMALDKAVMLGYASVGAWTLAFGWHAAMAGRQLHSRSGWVLAMVEVFFGAALLLRLLAMSAGWSPAEVVAESWDFALLVLAGLAAALYGNLGYLGMVVDRTSAAARMARDEQIAEQVQRVAAQKTSEELRALLQQRESMLQMLAHEIRQPLHNVNGAVQAAMLELQPAPADADPMRSLKQRTRERLLRAQAVQTGIQSVLDNTLAAASLMSRGTGTAAQQALGPVDTELDFLIQLVLGDLPAAQREQVEVQQHTALSSIELEPALVRLALRNLLRNAFEHGGAQVHVIIRLMDRQQAPALLLQVSDNGPELAPATLQRMRSDELGLADTAHKVQQLGLLIVHKVMALHGGTLHLEAGRHGGLVATMEFPT
jgi:signal transduction histidine kinase